MKIAYNLSTKSDFDPLQESVNRKMKI